MVTPQLTMLSGFWFLVFGFWVLGFGHLGSSTLRRLGIRTSPVPVKSSRAHTRVEPHNDPVAGRDRLVVSHRKTGTQPVIMFPYVGCCQVVGRLQGLGVLATLSGAGFWVLGFGFWVLRFAVSAFWGLSEDLKELALCVPPTRARQTRCGVIMPVDAGNGGLRVGRGSVSSQDRQNAPAL